MGFSLFMPFGIVIVLLVVAAIFLLQGKGAFMIAGYNTMSPAKKARYDEKALCRCTGWLLLAVAVCFALIPVGVQFNLAWLSYLSIALALAVVIGFLIYANTGKRFLKNESDISVQEAKPTSKAVIIGTVSIVIASLLGVCALTFFGAKDPAVHVHMFDSKIEIKGMYGLEIAVDEIAEISLIEESMEDIGVAARTNGFGGFGQTLKGHFRLNSRNEVLLFVQAKTVPTIKITRGSGVPDIYLSLRDGEATRALYGEIGDAFFS